MLRTRRLPGFKFEVQAPLPADILPRMDVACFVGFTAKGPLHLPVRVGSVPQFEMIFGEDIQLAWDMARGEQINGYLAPAVRGFFRNGGRTAWVIRVAGNPQTTHFPVTGLLEVQFGEDGIPEIHPAFAQARSPGSWADSIRVSTSLLSSSIALCPIRFDSPEFIASLSSPDELIPGDLLRLTFESGSILACTVKSIESIEVSPLQPNQYRVTCDQAVWFQSAWNHPSSVQTGQAWFFGNNGETTQISVSIPLSPSSPVELDWPRVGSTDVRLDIERGPTPPLGAWVRVDLDGEQLWLRVKQVSASQSGSSPLGEGVQISGTAFWWTSTPAALSEPIDLVERLAFELWALSGDDRLPRISDLTFDKRHPRYWNSLPTDSKLYTVEQPKRSNLQVGLWAEATDPRFPLAGEDHPWATFVPLAVPAIPDFYMLPELAVTDRLTRDGLGAFDATLFLDPDLTETCVRDLINEADTLRYYAPRPRPLQGIHAILGLDEVTLVLVPDAVHRSWERLGVDEPPPAQLLDPLQRSEWWHFLDCDPKPVIPMASEPMWGEFLNCGIRVIEKPYLNPVELNGLDTFSLTWTTLEPSPTFVVEEATRPDFKDAVEIYIGHDTQLTLHSHPPGIFYYHVRCLTNDQSSDWSNGQVVSLAAFRHWTAQEPRFYSDTALLLIQHALLRLCAARGDLFTVLALPEHYRTAEVLAHIHKLTTGIGEFCGPEEPRTLSFGAVYHPWMIGREENRPDEFRRTPPDGAMAGIIARRTLARGAWLAPANELLKGVIALTPTVERNAWQEFQDAQVNLIQHRPEGFTVFNNDTLTGDPDLRPINVRRLLILLRRLALQLGPTYVFEPNDSILRRSVQRGFEAALDELFRRGAFAGATATEAYQVVTSDVVNTRQSVDMGRFIVELKVAPSLPLTFVTIRLVQSGDRTLIMQEV